MLEAEPPAVVHTAQLRHTFQPAYSVGLVQHLDYCRLQLIAFAMLVADVLIQVVLLAVAPLPVRPPGLLCRQVPAGN